MAHLTQFSLAVLLLVAGSQSFTTAALHANNLNCKTLPGNPRWPSVSQWKAFNKTVNGRLIRTVPIGTPCHAAHFDAEACAAVQNGWRIPAFHDDSSSSVMTPFFANNSCNPFTGPDSPCVIGTYVQYAVNVSTPAHVVDTVKFARQHNIRFVVRNTGHDYMGKSTGTGALAVWTHHLKDTTWFPGYKSSGYIGPAVKVAAGVQVHELYEAADARNHTIVAGACPTVGFAGGYIQGGGHSPLSSIHGMAADQTLSFEVVTTTGLFVTASPSQNPDLYWALSGGGGGTYGIVWSVTVKVHPPVSVASASLFFTTTSNVTLDAWWSAVDVYQASAPKYNAAGGYGITQISTGSFALHSLFVPGHINASSSDATQNLQRLLQPLLNHLDVSGIPYNHAIATYPSFLSAYIGSFTPELFYVALDQFGSGRLLPMALWENERRFKEMTTVLRDIANDGGSLIELFNAPSLSVSGLPLNRTVNAVLPAWRQSQKLVIPTLRWNDTASSETIDKQRHTLTWVYSEALRRLTPESGAYLNEADTSEPDWKNSFYGVNYQKLLETKDKWDPDQMLYGSTAVGGDRWEENARGALCKV